MRFTVSLGSFPEVAFELVLLQHTETIQNPFEIFFELFMFVGDQYSLMVFKTFRKQGHSFIQHSAIHFISLSTCFYPSYFMHFHGWNCDGQLVIAFVIVVNVDVIVVDFIIQQRRFSSKTCQAVGTSCSDVVSLSTHPYKIVISNTERFSTRI